jgi:hypothetical protein
VERNLVLRLAKLAKRSTAQERQRATRLTALGYDFVRLLAYSKVYTTPALHGQAGRLVLAVAHLTKPAMLTCNAGHHVHDFRSAGCMVVCRSRPRSGQRLSFRTRHGSVRCTSTIQASTWECAVIRVTSSLNAQYALPAFKRKMAWRFRQSGRTVEL